MESLENQIKDLKYMLTTAKFPSLAEKSYYEAKLMRLQSLLKANKG